MASTTIHCCFGAGSYDDEPTPWFVKDGIHGMPWPQSVKNSVMFIGTRDGGKFKPRATGFLVSYHEDGLKFVHLVTAEHVISSLTTSGHKIWARANMATGETGEFPIDAADFYYYPDDANPTDVAVCAMPASLKSNDTGELIRIAMQTIPLNGPKPMAATDDIVKSRSIGIGDEIGIVGLFRSHHGLERNVPILRTGNIAAMCEEPVFTSYAGHIEAYLVEARSISGLSGSPVFVSMMGRRHIDGVLENGINLPAFYLLGLMHGHFDIANLSEDTAIDTEIAAPGGINTGIGVVIPVQKIIETIQSPELVAMRKKAVEDYRKKAGAVPDISVDDADAPNTTDANPNHLEDFKTLVGAAVRKQKPTE